MTSSQVGNLAKRVQFSTTRVASEAGYNRSIVNLVTKRYFNSRYGSLHFATSTTSSPFDSGNRMRLAQVRYAGRTRRCGHGGDAGKCGVRKMWARDHWLGQPRTNLSRDDDLNLDTPVYLTDKTYSFKTTVPIQSLRSYSSLRIQSSILHNDLDHHQNLHAHTEWSERSEYEDGRHRPQVR